MGAADHEEVGLVLREAARRDHRGGRGGLALAAVGVPCADALSVWSRWRWHARTRRSAALAGPPALAALFGASVTLDPHEPACTRMACVVIWVAGWWLLEPVPFAVTALLPVVLMPTLGIEGKQAAASAYFNDAIMLFLGSFILAVAVEKWDLHRRIALTVLVRVGSRPRALLIAFIATTAFLSAFISNTATAVLMVPLAASVMDCLPQDERELEEVEGGGRGEDERRALGGVCRSDHDEDDTGGEGVGRSGSIELLQRYKKGALLAIAYAASIGGAATLTGTGPNLVLAGTWGVLYPERHPLSWLQWLLFGFPFSWCLLGILAAMTVWMYCPEHVRAEVAASLDAQKLQRELISLGPPSFAEKVLVADFAAMALLWLTRAPGMFDGWGELFDGLVGDGTVAIAASIILFAIPAGGTADEPKMLMDWPACVKLPWDAVLLLGGGFALSSGASASGLSKWIGEELAFLEWLPAELLVPAVAAVISLTTTFCSNVATANLFLPILSEVSAQIGRDPLFLMVPGTLACSLAFALPVSTPPNAIAFATGALTTADLVYMGSLLSAVSLVVLAFFMPTLGEAVFGY